MLGKRISLAIAIADVLAVPLALLAAYGMRYGSDLWVGVARPTPAAPFVVALVSLCAWLMLYETMALDGFRDGWHLPGAVSRIFLAVGIQMGVVLTLAYLLRLYLSRLVLIYFAGLFFALALTIRLAAFAALRWRRKAGKTRRTVLLGEGRVVSELAQRIERHPEVPYEVVGFLKASASSGNGAQAEDAKVSDGLSSVDVLDLLAAQKVRELIVCLEFPPSLELQNFMIRCRGQGIRVNLLPHAYELYSAKASLFEIDGVPLITLEEPNNFRTTAIVKRIGDLTVGSVLLVFAVPVLVVAASGLWLRKKRVLRREMRCGLLGRPFWMFRLDVDRNDPHASAFDQFLTRLSISELPQLLNVFVGHMSLVGPRPESPDRVREYSEWQRQRLKIKPGMTGLAQVNGLREYHSSEEKARYDLQYMVRWTPVIDMVLLLQTIWTLLARPWNSRERSAHVAVRQEESQVALVRPSPE